MSEEKFIKRSLVLSPKPISSKEYTLQPVAHFSKHAYDIDAIGIYYQLKDLLQKYQPSGNFDKENYLQGIVYLIESYCKTSNLNFSFYIKSKDNYLIIPSSSNSYFSFLTYELTYYDIHKIKRFLDYQKENFSGNEYADKDNFTGYLEYLSYYTIKHLSLFQTEERLEKIMEWVQEERKKEVANPNPIARDFYYWKSGREKLILMHELLLRENKIEKNEHFVDSFRERKVNKDKRTKWLVTQTQLVFLCYLVFDGIEYNGETIYKIIARLFIKADGSEFNERLLNTVYTDNVDRFSGREKLPKGLSSIKKIFEDFKSQF